MKKIWSNYKQTIILIVALIIGAIVGLVYGEKATVLSPFGDLFMNLMFVIIVPLIFLTITTSIAKIKEQKRLGKVIITIFVTFLITSIIAVGIGLIATYSFKLVNPNDSAAILETLDNSIENGEKLNILERTVQAISVGDFTELISKNSIIALVVFSIIFGLAINKVGEKADALVKVLDSANHVVLKVIDIIFLYAPIGLGCYFASLIGSFGKEIAVGFGKTFVIYLVVAILTYFIVYSLYALLAGGKKGFANYWKNIAGPTATSIATCSSAACIPINVKSTKAIGVPDDISETTIPLGTSFHKEGSVIGSVFKIMFLVYLFGTSVSIGKVALVALVATLLITAVPVGGGTISEMMILSMMGFPLAALPILTIIATIIDPPATMLNVTDDAVSAMLVTRVVDGKHWLDKEEKPKKRTKKEA